MTEQHEGNPQDVQDQITDIIVNEYEADHRYSRKELRRILDSIVDVIDQHVGHKVYAGPGHIDSRGIGGRRSRCAAEAQSTNDFGRDT